MSQIFRQSQLFAGEDFRKIYKSFKDATFTAYDPDTIKQVMVNYIRSHYPEDFTDYTEGSEYIAMIELLAFLGASISFRTDLNSRNNIMDTAERRDAIIRLARMINYTPKRNICAKGLFKLSSIQTNQMLRDSFGNDLNNLPIFWNDPNNEDWLDQFVHILNSAFNRTNPFGSPSKSGIIGGINTQLYQLNNILGLDVAYNVVLNVNGESIPVDIVNPDLIDNEVIFERNPNQNEPFNLIYRNDTMGFSSNNSGFFLFFKQGALQSVDNVFEYPVPNRVTSIDIQNINNTDVFVQEVNSIGEVVENWTKVPVVSGNNVIFNSLNTQDKNIFEVISGPNDTISLKFSDGNFGNVPTGIIRTWVRSSINRNLTIRPEDAENLSISVPYVGVDGMEYILRLNFGLEETVSNSAPTETSEQIKLRAPQVYYTQDRMVNNEDYNVFPLSYGNTISKLRAINRTYAGHSRYIDTNDPTGFHKDLIVTGQDGALYKESSDIRSQYTIPSSMLSVPNYFINIMEQTLSNTYVSNFYYSTFLSSFPSNYFSFPPNDIGSTSDNPIWKTMPSRAKNDTGYFIDSVSSNTILMNTTPYRFVKRGAIIEFENPTTLEKRTSAIRYVNNIGNPPDPQVSNIGPIGLNNEVVEASVPTKIYPDFRRSFTSAERIEITSNVNNFVTFALGYDLDNDSWYVIESSDISDSDFDYSTMGTATDSSWIIKLEFNAGDTQTPPYYTVIARGLLYIFESRKSVRFFWGEDDKIYDSVTGRALKDEIKLLKTINTDRDGNPLDTNAIFNISGVYIQDDGYQETARVEVTPEDGDDDGIPDDPALFNKIVSESDYIVFESYVDDNTYERSRPVSGVWVDLTGVATPIVDVPNRTIGGFDVAGPVLFMVDDMSVVTHIISELNGSGGFGGTVADASAAEAFMSDFGKAVFRLGDQPIAANNKFIGLQTGLSLSLEPEAQSYVSTHVFEKNGKSFTQDSSVPKSNRQELYFTWKHYAPADQRIDPAPSNIIDMVLITNDYLKSVYLWKDSNLTMAQYPIHPTTEQLRIEYSDLNKYKSVSDHLSFKSGKFKLLFGSRAPHELQATFKVIKIPSVIISDNEIKTKVIQSIDEYFDINNWSFGEKFYFTELGAFIHSKLSRFISSIVIVPKNGSSEFGDLFEIPSMSDELFLSTATVADVEIVKNFNETNLRM